MNLQIQKRNGDIVEFQKEKVVDALTKAFLEVDGILYETDTINDIADDVEFLIRGNALVKDNKILTVEEIQNYIEDLLMRSERKDVARAYIRYRYKREVAREYSHEFLNAIAEKLDGKNIENQNANVDEQSFGGRMGEAARVMTKKYALDNNISKMARENHENNMIYIHDLDSYAIGMHNCLTIPFDDLLAKGFDTRQTDVRTANSINTAFQLIAVIFQLESLQQFGGVSASHIDWTMVPYVRKSFFKHYIDGMKYLTYDCPETHYLDKFIQVASVEMSIEDEYYQVIPSVYQYAIDMTRRETHQAVEGMYHNLNTLQSRSGNQLPFTSINYGTCTLPEGRLVIDAILDVSIEGLGRHHKTSIFPCGIF
jgi:ribonucleoside-triphosphate reductase